MSLTLSVTHPAETPLDPSTLTRIWTCLHLHVFLAPVLRLIFLSISSTCCPPSSSTFSLSLPRTSSDSPFLSSILSPSSFSPFQLFFFLSLSLLHCLPCQLLLLAVQLSCATADWLHQFCLRTPCPRNAQTGSPPVFLTRAWQVHGFLRAILYPVSWKLRNFEGFLPPHGHGASSKLHRRSLNLSLESNRGHVNPVQ